MTPAGLDTKLPWGYMQGGCVGIDSIEILEAFEFGEFSSNCGTNDGPCFIMES